MKEENTYICSRYLRKSRFATKKRDKSLDIDEKYIDEMIKKIIITLLVFCCAIEVQAQNPYSSPKRELRSAWVATVWGIDWPDANASVTGQKAAMTRMLDSLKNNNFNAVNFQVRSMCDAMYKSSLEPWSSYLTGKRGQDPGYDPLAFVVSECHKRGLECHAWINPYRTIARAGTPQDREVKDGGHLLTYGKYTVIDPAQQWTIDRIVNVCREIVTHYDVDGILYDDYFYPNDIPTNSTAGDYREYLESGTTMSMGDWRRDNVNRMVKAVYDMIQAVKPYLRFGISPAGMACTSQTLADHYGIDPMPAGSDWQYDGIFSDPLAWLKSQDLDFISPQVYWKIHSKRADYGLIAPWWCEVAKKYGRHAYISASIDHVKSEVEFSEWANEVEMNRSNSLPETAGTIFWSVTNLYKKTGFREQLAHYLKRTVYNYPALPPLIPWRNNKARKAVQVKGITKQGDRLSWYVINQVRYSVYAIPQDIDPLQVDGNVKYLLGMAYNPENEHDQVTYTLPSDKIEGYNYVVKVLDRYGNEY